MRANLLSGTCWMKDEPVAYGSRGRALGQGAESNV
jgi:hypothetical protein